MHTIFEHPNTNPSRLNTAEDMKDQVIEWRSNCLEIKYGGSS